ncbi:MAG: FAD:protein FMN transferase [Solirubrobacterales bacterium]|nr:FAD:protein FMN transferase [Solirubrobacterales bacterium]
MISCGGDIRIGGSEASRFPYDVLVEHPASGNKPHLFKLGSGGIATSGINSRAWHKADGSPAHHLLDPSTGDPCWSGLLGATALGPTSLEAETLAKAALLSGPEGGRRILSRYGGMIVHESNRVELVGRATIRLRLPEVSNEESTAAA